MVAAASPRGNIAGKVFSAYNKYGVKYAEKSNAKRKLAAFYRIYKDLSRIIAQPDSCLENLRFMKIGKFG
jgi:hypothetical protein